MLEIWRMQCTPSLPSLPGPLWPGVGAANRVLSMGQIELISSFERLLFLHLNSVLFKIELFKIELLELFKIELLFKTELFKIELFLHLNCVFMLN